MAVPHYCIAVKLLVMWKSRKSDLLETFSRAFFFFVFNPFGQKIKNKNKEKRTAVLIIVLILIHNKLTTDAHLRLKRMTLCRSDETCLQSAFTSFLGIVKITNASFINFKSFW